MDNNTNIIYDLQDLYSVGGNKIFYWNKLLDKLNSSEDNSQFVNYIKYILLNQPNNGLTLDILDFIIHHGNNRMISLIAERDLMEKFINLLKKEVNTNIEIQKKVIYLVQKWSYKFKNNSIFPIFSDSYEFLMNNGIIFPPLDTHFETYDKYIKDYEVIQIENNDNDYNNNLQNNYNKSFYNNDGDESFLSDCSLLNKLEETISNPVIMDNNAYNQYNRIPNENNNIQNYNKMLLNKNNNNPNNIYINNSYNNENKTINIYNSINQNSNDYNNNYKNNNINNQIKNNTSEILEPIKEKNKWCGKIKYYNNIIDNERGGICYNDNLRYGMQEFSEKIGMINLLISKYSIANDFNTRDMFIKVRNDMEMTLFRYNQLLSNKKVIPFYSAFDGNKKRYDENYYSENYYCQDNINEKINENNSNSENTFYIYGNKIKNTIVNFGCTIKEKTIDGYDYLRDKIKGNKDLYGYDYSKNNECYYPSYSNYKVDDNINYNNIYNNNNNENNNDNKNDNDSNNNEEKKQTFFDNVKEGFFNIGQSIKNLYKKDE